MFSPVDGFYAVVIRKPTFSFFGRLSKSLQNDIE